MKNPSLGQTIAEFLPNLQPLDFSQNFVVGPPLLGALKKKWQKVLHKLYKQTLGFFKKLEKLGPNFGCLSPLLMVNIVFFCRQFDHCHRRV